MASSRLIVDLAEAAITDPKPEFSGATHRFNHVQFSPGGRRFAVLHRWKTPDQEVGETRLLTFDPDGVDRCCLADHGFVSHYDWRDDHSVLAYANNGCRDGYFLFDERGGEPQPMGAQIFTSDGHCSFSPDRRWVLTDTYPDATHHRVLMLYHWSSGECIEIGRFHAMPVNDWTIRCDLHPRWSPDGRRICLDSIHEGPRQIYVLDVSDIVDGG